jgi:primosomal protein N''
MDISFSSNIAAVMAEVTEREKKRVAWATKQTLDKVAALAKETLTQSLDEQINNPTPFTKMGIGTSNARTNNLQSGVFLKEFQTKYMQYQVLGGRREQKPYEKKLAAYVGDRVTVISTHARQNKYGNLSRATINKIVERVMTRPEGVNIGDKQYFIGRPRGGGNAPDGVWERLKSRKIKPVLIFVSKADYTKRFKFKEVAEKAIKENFNRLFDEELNRQLR